MSDVLKEILEMADGETENYDFDLEAFELIEEEDFYQNGKYQYRSCVYYYRERDVYFSVFETRSGSYHSDWYYNAPDVNICKKPIKMVEIAEKELQRLRECEALLWDVESALPSGLESWIDDEVLQTLRGE